MPLRIIYRLLFLKESKRTTLVVVICKIHWEQKTSLLNSNGLFTVCLLPRASEGWGKVIFSVCMSVYTQVGGGGTTARSQSEMGVGVTPILPDRGVPQPGQDGGTPPPRLDWMGYMLAPLPTRQSSNESICYAMGGMPLGFTQEDFLSRVNFSFFSLFSSCDDYFIEGYL